MSKNTTTKKKVAKKSAVKKAAKKVASKVAKKATKKVAKKKVAKSVKAKKAVNAKNAEQRKQEQQVMAIELISVVYNPRKKFTKKPMDELVASIKAMGIVQPLVIRYDEEVGDIFLVAGERRLRAAKLAGLTEVPIVVTEASEKEAREIALVENLQREDLDLMEEADAFHDLMDCGWSVAEMIERFGYSNGYIYSRLEARKFDPKVKAALSGKEVTLQVASTLARIDDDKQRERALDEVVHPKLQETPLAKEKALALLKKDYIEPQNAAKKWNAREKSLLAENPGCEFIKYEDKGEYEGYGHGYVNIDSTLAWWDLKEEIRDNIEQKQLAHPTWKMLCKRHGAFKKIVCGSDGEPKLLVDENVLKAADAEWTGDDYFLKRAAAEKTDEEKLEEKREEVQAEQKKAVYDGAKAKWLGKMLSWVKNAKPENMFDVVMRWYDEESNQSDYFFGEIEMLLNVEFKEHETEGKYCDENYAQCREMFAILAKENPTLALVTLMLMRDMTYDSSYERGMTEFSVMFLSFDDGDEQWEPLRAKSLERQQVECEEKEAEEKAKAEVKSGEEDV